jgi:putative thioredoxin
MIQITLDNFQTDVIAASNIKPVVVDLGSPRSPISQTLTSTLIRLETEFGGAFTLACANCDLVPQVAQAFQVQQIPTCIVLVNGQPVDGFSGAVPEAQIRDLLNKYARPIAAVAPEVVLLEQAKVTAAAQDLNAATNHCKAAIALNPAYTDARLMLAALLLDTQPLLAQVQYDAIDASRLDAAQAEQYALLHAEIAQRLSKAQAALESPEILTLKANVANAPKDLSARLALAEAYKNNQAYELALEQLLEIVKTDRAFNEDIGRKTMIEVFALASDTPDVVRAWRQKLSAALN